MVSIKIKKMKFINGIMNILIFYIDYNNLYKICGAKINIITLYD